MLGLPETAVPSFDSPVEPGSAAANYVAARYEAGWSIRRIIASVKIAGTGNPLHYRQARRIIDDSRTTCLKCETVFYGSAREPKYCCSQCCPGNKTDRRGRRKPKPS